MSHAMFMDILTAFASCLFLLWLLNPIACHIGLVDHPGGRKTHEHPTPLSGGIAMFVAFVFAVLSSKIPLSEYRLLFAGTMILVVVGVLDDFHELSARMRFGAQIAASLLMALGGGVVLRDMGYLILPDQLIPLGILAVPVTVFATVGVINAVNMTDGLDGLAASLVLVTIGALGIVAQVAGETKAVAILVLLAAVALAFLVFNLRIGGRALAFMGDAGSMFLGFVLAWFLIEFSQGEARLFSPVVALWLFALPLIDTVTMMTRRLWLGRSPFLADREHFHHLLLAAGFSAKQTVAIMILLGAVAAGIGLTGHFLNIPEHWMFFGFLVVFSLHFWTVMRAWRMKKLLHKFIG